MNTVLMVAQVLVSIGLIATVLLQSGKSAGVSGIVSGGAEAVFGKKKGMDELLHKITIVLATVFLFITLLLAILW